jgi:hypothetical protein
VVVVCGRRRCRGSGENYGGTACVPLCMRGEREVIAENGLLIKMCHCTKFT